MSLLSFNRANFFLLCLVSTLTSTSGLAATAPEAIADVALSPAGSFTVKMDEVSGDVLEKDGEKGVTFEAKRIAISLRSLKTGLSLRDKHAKDKYLEIEKFPEAVLTEAAGANGEGHGKLLFHGVEREVRGTYKFQNQTLEAEFPILLSEFGIAGINYLGIGVQDRVVIHIKLPVAR